MSERKSCQDLWGDYHFLAEQLRIHIYCYLADFPDTRDKIFKLNLAMYKDAHDEKIIGIKLFPDNSVRVLVRHDYGTAWDVLNSTYSDFPDGVSRIDLLMWICDELDDHLSNTERWVEDESLLEIIE